MRKKEQAVERHVEDPNATNSGGSPCARDGAARRYLSLRQGTARRPALLQRVVGSALESVVKRRRFLGHQARRYARGAGAPGCVAIWQSSFLLEATWLLETSPE